MSSTNKSTQYPPTPAFGGFNFDLLSPATPKEQPPGNSGGIIPPPPPLAHHQQQQQPIPSPGESRKSSGDDEYTPPSPSAYPIGPSMNGVAPAKPARGEDSRMHDASDSSEREEGELSDAEEEPPAPSPFVHNYNLGKNSFPGLPPAPSHSFPLPPPPVSAVFNPGFARGSPFRASFSNGPHMSYPEYSPQTQTFNPGFKTPGNPYTQEQRRQSEGWRPRAPQPSPYINPPQSATTRSPSTGTSPKNKSLPLPPPPLLPPPKPLNMDSRGVFYDPKAPIEQRLDEGRKLAENAIKLMLPCNVTYDDLVKQGVHPAFLSKLYSGLGLPTAPIQPTQTTRTNAPLPPPPFPTQTTTKPEQKRPVVKIPTGPATKPPVLSSSRTSIGSEAMELDNESESGITPIQKTASSTSEKQATVVVREGPPKVPSQQSQPVVNKLPPSLPSKPPPQIPGLSVPALPSPSAAIPGLQFGFGTPITPNMTMPPFPTPTFPTPMGMMTPGMIGFFPPTPSMALPPPPAPTQQPVSTATSTNASATQGALRRKRPTASEFIAEAPKRKFGAPRKGEKLIIDISDDESDSGLYTAPSTKPPSPKNANGKLMPPTPNGVDLLRDKEEMIKKMKEQIAAREKQKQKPLKIQMPTPSTAVFPVSITTPATTDSSTEGAKLANSLIESVKKEASSTPISPIPSIPSTPDIINKTELIKEKTRQLEMLKKAQRNEELKRRLEQEKEKIRQREQELEAKKAAERKAKEEQAALELEKQRKLEEEKRAKAWEEEQKALEAAEAKKAKASKKKVEQDKAKLDARLRLRLELEKIELEKKKMLEELEKMDNDSIDLTGDSDSEQPATPAEAPMTDAPAVQEKIKEEPQELPPKPAAPPVIVNLDDSSSSDSSSSESSDSESDSEDDSTAMDVDQSDSEDDEARPSTQQATPEQQPRTQTNAQPSPSKEAAKPEDVKKVEPEVQQSEDTEDSDSEMSESSDSSSSSSAMSTSPMPSETIVEEKGHPEDAKDEMELDTQTNEEVKGDGTVAREVPHVYTPYVSPLTEFRSFRLHPQFQEFVKGGYLSLTYSNAIDPHKSFCTYEFNGGQCNDKQCPYQHWNNITMSEQDLMFQLGFVIEGQTEEEKTKYRVGLSNLINGLRKQGITQFIEILTAIGQYRREFVGDKTVVLDLTKFPQPTST